MGLKSSKYAGENLSEAELEALVLCTQMSRAEILKWHKGFMIDCPSGRLTKKEFIKIYEELFPSVRAKRFCDNVFDVFDKANSKTIDFNEFIIACSLTSRGKSKEKLRASFQLYESESNELLSKEEMQRIIKAVHELYAGIKLTDNDSLRKVDCLINQFDNSKSGLIKKADFFEGVSTDPQIKNAIYKQDSSKSLKGDQV